jgi:hypothetical protein
VIAGEGEARQPFADAQRWHVLYVDADWVSFEGNAPLHGLAVAEGRMFALGAPEHTAQLADPAESGTRAAEILVAYAGRVAAALEGRDSVDIVGVGAAAALVRLLVGATRESTRPEAIAVLSSDADEIPNALARLTDLGTLVLACPANGGGPLNLYDHVHRRGLRIVGLPGPSVDEESLPGIERERLLGEALRLLREVPSLARAAPHTGWYRVAVDPSKAASRRRR